MSFLQDTRIFHPEFERKPKAEKRRFEKCPKCNKDAIIHCHVCGKMFCMDHRWPDEGHQCEIKKEG